MSQISEDREKLIASVLDAFNRHDPGAVRGLVHPEYEFHSRIAALDGRVYQGPAGFEEYFGDIDDGFVESRWEFDEAEQPPDDDKLFVVFRFTAHGRESGIPIDRLAPQVWSFRDGLVWRNVSFASKAEALEAAGLSE